jgi:hypothetical protein
MERPALLQRIMSLIWAALVALLGFGLIADSHEFFGLLALLLSFSLAVRGAFEVIFLTVFGLVSTTILLIIFWGPLGFFENVSFFDWIADNWFIAVFYVFLVMYSIIKHLKLTFHQFFTLTYRKWYIY